MLQRFFKFNRAFTSQTTKKFVKYDPQAPEPEIDPKEFKRMQESLQKFAQAMGLGKYQLAQTILDDHRIDI